MNQIQTWTKKWNIQLNETKSVHINITNRHCEHIPVTINLLVTRCTNKFNTQQLYVLPTLYLCVL
jgi:hypothetical protein